MARVKTTTTPPNHRKEMYNSSSMSYNGINNSNPPLIPILWEDGAAPSKGENEALVGGTDSYHELQHPNNAYHPHMINQSMMSSYGSLEHEEMNDVVMVLPSEQVPEFFPRGGQEHFAPKPSPSNQQPPRRHRRSRSNSDDGRISKPAQHRRSRSTSHVPPSRTPSSSDGKKQHTRMRSNSDVGILKPNRQRRHSDADLYPPPENTSWGPPNVKFSAEPLVIHENATLTIPPPPTRFGSFRNTSPFQLRNESTSLRRSKQHMRHHSVQLFMDSAKGKPQPLSCHDIPFALLFVLQLAAIIYLGIRYGPDAYLLNNWSEYTPETIQVDYLNVLQLALICGAFTCIISTLALFLMMLTRKLIRYALFFSIFLSFLWIIFGFVVVPTTLVPVAGILASMISVGYTFVVWDRINFAEANVHAGLCAVKDNLGGVGVAFFFQGVALMWSVWWVYTSVGIYDRMNDVVGWGWKCKLAFVALGVSYYWTFKVILHIVQVTIAGIIQNWWSNSNKNSSDATWKSFCKSITTSFGSICFGSLFVGFVQTAFSFSTSFRSQRSNNIFLFLQEFILRIGDYLSTVFETLLRHFNSWAFTYVGLYGYGFLEAGKEATTLFEKRGWNEISTDYLMNNVLFIFCLAIGGCTGYFAFLVEKMSRYSFTSFHQPETTAFLIGFLIGFVLSCVLLSIVDGAVNTVIVCFAGSPLDLERNYPEISRDMKDAWKEVWPGCTKNIDLRLMANDMV